MCHRIHIWPNQSNLIWLMTNAFDRISLSPNTHTFLFNCCERIVSWFVVCMILRVQRVQSILFIIHSRWLVWLNPYISSHSHKYTPLSANYREWKKRNENNNFVYVPLYLSVSWFSVLFSLAAWDSFLLFTFKTKYHLLQTFWSYTEIVMNQSHTLKFNGYCVQILNTHRFDIVFVFIPATQMNFSSSIYCPDDKIYFIIKK